MVTEGAGYFVRTYLEPVWSKALADGEVTGTASALVGQALRAVEARAASSAVGNRFQPPSDLQKFVAEAVALGLFQLQEKYDASFLTAVQLLVAKATAEHWQAADFKASVLALADLYGASGLRGSYAESWFQTAVLAQGFNQGVLLTFNAQPTRRLYPFLQFRTVGDDRVRVAHADIERVGLAAAPEWPGWLRFAPPLDWNCRCTLVPIVYNVARALGWLGHELPLGSEVLSLPGKASAFLEASTLPFGFLPYQ
jgi:hypothetical protein